MRLRKNGLAVRKNAGLSASLEDYLEAILNVADSSGMARSRDIAASLGVARPSVTGALRMLAKKRLVNYRPYGYVTLTQAGLAQAGRVAKKHDIIKSFLTDILGVDAPAAQKAACKAEHLLGPVIVSRMRDFTDFARKRARLGVSRRPLRPRSEASESRRRAWPGENLMDVLGRFSKAKRSKG